MQIQIDKIKTGDSMLKKEEEELNAKLSQTEQNLEEVETKLAEAYATKKSYEHMLDRMKKDELIYQKNSSNVERNLRMGKVRLNRNVENLIKSKREDEETKHALNMVNSAIQYESHKRELDLKRMKNVVMKRKFLERKRAERLQRQKEVAENAATESKDVNEVLYSSNRKKKWRRLLMVHKFLAFFLKKKMDRELRRFKVVEEAFRKIKSTTVSN